MYVLCMIMVHIISERHLNLKGKSLPRLTRKTPPPRQKVVLLPLPTNNLSQRPPVLQLSAHVNLAPTAQVVTVEKDTAESQGKAVVPLLIVFPSVGYPHPTVRKAQLPLVIIKVAISVPMLQKVGVQPLQLPIINNQLKSSQQLCQL